MRRYIIQTGTPNGSLWVVGSVTDEVPAIGGEAIANVIRVALFLSHYGPVDGTHARALTVDGREIGRIALGNRGGCGRV